MTRIPTARLARHRGRTAVATATVVAALTGFVTLSGTAGATASASKTDRPRPTIVLEHGAFADAAGWTGVIKRLTRAGYPVVAAANPLRGPASDAAYLGSVLDRVEGSVVLVGHSYGGTVISEAAVGREKKVKALVYVAAFLPDRGETSLGLSNKYPGSTLGDAVDAVPYVLPDGGQGQDLCIRPDKFRGQFAADVSRDQAAIMAATQRPIAAAALEEPSVGAAWKRIPTWSLIATQDFNIPPAAQRFMSERAHARTVEVKASHAVAVSHPASVARLVRQAADATAR
ncbi:alpha/beta fold hydrolase [Streptomyces stelliscabiei]|uniref:Pimeloyl-ACP methyl ester carboxylesterase n=1 Tax=Streptomyces stelliscabiei TaxID=146820 RepID=A0A8I0PJ29_9ACTN|nr:alpha/beta hydrolase [Streptomyces stelliscabiei]KND41727.1 alpha/beta hydrolase [Streptomyces stelliscabiei]MBE1602403.1 pimeloyl-ACP methyl ester carboxylesterase [Streptomyces stelliscabiei]MDX2516628.1 alpha/beta hydrolase [Streptomyces stelliscabiei]MDX2550373.1 alpha/beta hydrolase [Streptomyces stelliscabiei]MDX2610071.1 alpha/beta hydrolase [Streptomyces stelliscabiei]